MARFYDWRIERIDFALSKRNEWWFKAHLFQFQMQGGRRAIHETRWIPVPVHGFEPPEGTRLARETAIVPDMSVEEWSRHNVWSTGRPREDF
jgi:hypothetical protein